MTRIREEEEDSWQHHAPSS